MLFLIPTLAFFLVALKQIFFWTYIWQLKEYRLDRLLVHIKETKQGRGIFLSPWVGATFFVSLSYIGVILYDWFSYTFQLLVILLLFSLAFKTVSEVMHRKIKRPRFTPKALAILFLAGVSTLLLFFFPLTDRYVWFLVEFLLIPFFVALYVFLFAFPTEVYTDILIQRAYKKIKDNKKLKIIAVSGSYGKSTTKEIVAHILSQKYAVVKTQLSNNTPIAIAKTILTSITPSTDFFIVEMGAYKRGEIAQLCNMVQPHVTITTAISDQHLSLYGSIQDVIDSEEELLKALRKNGVALLNGNSPLTQVLHQRVKQKKIIYKTSTHAMRNIISGFAIHPTLSGVSFQFAYQKHTLHSMSPLLGAHTVENLLPAIYCGLFFGLTIPQIEKGVRSLTPMPKTMQKVQLPHNAIGIDDTFNASPESVIAVATYMNLFRSKKIFVLTPLIELGKSAKERHRQIGEALVKADYVFVTNKNWNSEIQEGIHKAGGSALLQQGSFDEIASLVTQLAQKNDIVIFEGKEAGIVLKKIL